MVDVRSTPGNALLSSIGFILLLSSVRTLLEVATVLPVSLLTFKKDSVYVSLLMATSLTFGLVLLRLGTDRRLIDQTQFSILVIVMIIGALAPMLTAHRCFDPWKDRN